MTVTTEEVNLEELGKEIQVQAQLLRRVKNEVHKRIIGQEDFIDRLLLGIISSGHILVEGVPGLAKTETIKTLAKVVGLESQRIQFTPDLLPADLIGTQIYNPNEKVQNFEVKKGPLFSNLILADEINRAPAKVQSALLEAMAEKSITIGDETFKLSEPFIVLATQNPLEQEGTYTLPEAQMDRFLMKVKIGYPERKDEKQIMNLNSKQQDLSIDQVISKEELFKAREIVDKIYVDEKIQDYILDIVFATRLEASSKQVKKSKIKELKELIEYGASPRASIALLLAAKTRAFIQSRAYVVPEDVKNIAYDILRHRIGLSFEAEAEEKTEDDIIRKILDAVEVP
jgi:MoxR-like ATPase